MNWFSRCNPVEMTIRNISKEDLPGNNGNRKYINRFPLQKNYGKHLFLQNATVFQPQSSTRCACLLKFIQAWPSQLF